jgi:hypothetical protein
MNWLQLIIVALDKLPVDRLFVRHTDDKSLERLEKILTQAPAIIPNKPIEAKTATDNITSGVQSNKGSGDVSYDELVLYQKKEIGKQLLLLQMHLEQGCKINSRACDCCLVPGTVIYGNPSPVFIEEPGTRVITHKGNIRQITEYFEREYHGQIQELVISYSNYPLLLTPEHPVLVVRNVRKRQRTIWRKSGISEGSLEWVPAGELTNRDFLAFPRLKALKDREDISLEMAELLGWYVAEGSCTENRVTFSLGKKEVDNIGRVRELIKLNFKVDPKIYEKPTVIHICHTDKSKIELFKEFGNGARKKLLPSWLIYLPTEKQKAFLKAAIAGDGYVGRYQIVYTTTSETLAYQLRLLLFRLGILNTISIREINESYIEGRKIVARGPRYDLHIAGDSARQLLVDFDGGKRMSGNHGWISENYAFLPVKSNSHVNYEGKVYNIAVEGDESYLTAQGAVHNCEKHPIAIEALSQETLGITGDSLYSELAGWAQALMPMTTAEASASGKYDEKYREMAIKSRDYRKRVMGSTRVQDLLDKEQAVKVEKLTQDILKSHSVKGGNHGGE